MFTNLLNYLQQLNRKWYFVVTIGGGLCLYGLSGMYWWNHHYMNPQVVFQGMLARNLSTPGATRITEGTSDSGKTRQEMQYHLGGQTFVRSRSVINNDTPEGQKASVVTESYTTPTEEYVRYTKLDISGGPKKPNFKDVVNVWGKSDRAQDSKESPRSLLEALLGTMPIANLSQEKRQALLAQMQKERVYDMGNGEVKRKLQNGRMLYTYSVKIRPGPYVSMLKQFAEDVGLGDVGLSPEGYADAPAISTTITVDAVSRQLVSLAYQDQSGRKETYSAYGAMPQPLPPASSIPVSELQGRIQKLLET